MRRKIPPLIAFIAMIVLAGCGSSSSSTSSSASTAAAATTQSSSSSSSKSLALIQGTKADNFYVTMGCGAKAEASKLGYSINVQGPADFAAPEQIPIVDAITAQHPGAVLIAPTDTHALIAPMQQMKSAGIKVIQVDTTVSDPSIAAASISSNNIEGGAKAADELAKLIGDKGSVIVMNEQAGVSTTEARIQGFLQEIKKYPGIKPLATQYVGDNPAKAAQAITAVYAAHPDLAGVFATNVLVAQGVDTGLSTAHAASKVKIVGYDADPTQVADLKSGIVQALIAQEPYEEGVDGVEQAVNALTGKPTQSILTGLAVLTRSNLASMSQYVYKSSC
ncbi:MAG: ABC transporter substrate-binding protein [Solirubrobacteraceae bacterium]